jgi:dethiobiotin synthetase
MGRTIFVTGTDTGVGKTILTGLLVAHALETAKNEPSGGLPVAALKPFCSGGRRDAELLWELQDRRIPLDVINPFHYAQALAPRTAARLENIEASFKQTLEAIGRVKAGLRLIEGAGGLLTPLGTNFAAADIVRQLACEVLVAAPNRLGMLNHTMLTLEALKHRGVSSVKIVVMNHSGGDESTRYNVEDLRELAAPFPVHEIPLIPGPLVTTASFCAVAVRLGDILSSILFEASQE